MKMHNSSKNKRELKMKLKGVVDGGVNGYRKLD